MCLASGASWAQGEQQPATAQGDLQQQINELRQRQGDYEQLKRRLDELEAQLRAGKDKSVVEAALKDTKIKIDGRMFAGVFKTGENGPDRRSVCGDANDLIERQQLGAVRQMQLRHRGHAIERVSQCEIGGVQGDRAIERRRPPRRCLRWVDLAGDTGARLRRRRASDAQRQDDAPKSVAPPQSKSLHRAEFEL
jgi:hypothetical protein